MGLARRRESAFADTHQMLLPLFIEVSFFSEPKPEVEAPLIEEFRDNQPELEEWTNEELVQLHQFLLEQSMFQALNPRSSKETRLEVLDWVDQITPYRQQAKAFSFDACCQFSGYNPEELRDHLHDEMKCRGIHPNPNRKN